MHLVTAAPAPTRARQRGLPRLDDPDIGRGGRRAPRAGRNRVGPACRASRRGKGSRPALSAPCHGRARREAGTPKGTATRAPIRPWPSEASARRTRPPCASLSTPGIMRTTRRACPVRREGALCIWAGVAAPFRATRSATRPTGLVAPRHGLDRAAAPVGVDSPRRRDRPAGARAALERSRGSLAGRTAHAARRRDRDAAGVRLPRDRSFPRDPVACTPRGDRGRERAGSSISRARPSSEGVEPSAPRRELRRLRLRALWRCSHEDRRAAQRRARLRSALVPGLECLTQSRVIVMLPRPRGVR
jgi:hypothetical protein